MNTTHFNSLAWDNLFLREPSSLFKRLLDVCLRVLNLENLRSTSFLYYRHTIRGLTDGGIPHIQALPPMIYGSK
jgi:hypothetical protein